jgi:hypothetical protein
VAARRINDACDLVSVEPGPIPFEASLAAPAGALLLVRAVVLPVDAAPGKLPGRVQIIVNWREVLDLAATKSLRSELGAELRLSSQDLSKIDLFSPKIGG